VHVYFLFIPVLYLFFVDIEAAYCTWPHSLTHTFGKIPLDKRSAHCTGLLHKTNHSRETKLLCPRQYSKLQYQQIFDRIPLDEGSAHCGVSCTTKFIHEIQNLYVPDDIRNCNPSKRAAAELRHGTRDHHIGLCSFPVLKSLPCLQQDRHDHALSWAIPFSCLNTRRSFPRSVWKLSWNMDYTGFWALKYITAILLCCSQLRSGIQCELSLNLFY
jgi:hypothetical protein